MNDLMSIVDLSKRFGTVKALDNINLSVQEGEILGIAGESGSGKTTLGRLMLRLIYPESGKIFYKKVDIFSMSPENERSYRKQVQIVFQNPYTSLDPRMRVGDIVEEPLMIYGERDVKARLGRVFELLDSVGLNRQFAGKYPHELSGGERQRVGIARALILKPKVLVLDEPVSSLDVSIQAQILNLLKKLKAQYNLTYIFISHDLSVVKYLCDRVVILQAGKIVETGNAEDIFSNPRQAYTKKLLASIPKLHH